jgi:methionyl aminopeptidase
MTLKTPGELDLMHEANRLVHRVLDGIAALIAPGVSTAELDRFAEAEIRGAGAVPAFLNYRGYPATLCTSINDVIVHGIPGPTTLSEGDVIGVDCGVIYKGYFGDAARTFEVGKVSEEASRLLAATKQALDIAVAEVKPGVHLSNIGAAVQRFVESQGFAVVREFVGHGIGTALHEEPQVPNFGVPGKGPKLKPGLVLAIEPMVTAGRPNVRFDADGWTARTADGSLAAHFEYSVAVTDDGHRVLGVG